MRMFVYTIFDSATAAYMRPFFMQSDGQATRAFSDIANDPDHDIGKHPEDYSLYRIGQWDDQKGEVMPDKGECIAKAREVQALHRTQVAENMARAEALPDNPGGTD